MSLHQDTIVFFEMAATSAQIESLKKLISINENVIDYGLDNMFKILLTNFEHISKQVEAESLT